MRKIKVEHINLSFCRIDPDPKIPILDQIWREHKVSYPALKSEMRKPIFVYCRYLFAVYMHENTDLSSGEIGDLINKDHATILYYLNKYQPII